MRISHHHVDRFPSTHFFQNRYWGSRLNKPTCPGVPQIVKAKIINASISASRFEYERSNLLADFFDAKRSGDEEAMRDVMERIKAFNSKHDRAETITGRTLMQSIKSRNRSMERTQAGVYLSKKREYLRGEGAFLDDEDDDE